MVCMLNSNCSFEHSNENDQMTKKKNNIFKRFGEELRLVDAVIITVEESLLMTCGT